MGFWAGHCLDCSESESVSHWCWVLAISPLAPQGWKDGQERGGSCGSESIRQVGEGKKNSQIQPSPLLRGAEPHFPLQPGVDRAGQDRFGAGLQD